MLELRSQSLATCALAVSSAFASNDPPCFFSESFEGPSTPVGWNVGAFVELLDDFGNGTGMFMQAWTIGNSDAANAHGYFPVPFRPGHGNFIMANDDAEPCDCGMVDVQLTSPIVDLTSRSGTALECSVFLDQAFNGGPLRIQATTDGTNWLTLRTITASPHDWQPVFIDLQAYDGNSSLQLRFAWSDNNEWGSGVAIDDVCIYERANIDLALVDLLMADVDHSAFDGGVRSLVYRQLPLEQALSSFKGSVVVMNRGLQPLVDVTAQLRILVGGSQMASQNASPISSLAPGARDTLIVDIGWSPSSTGFHVFDAAAYHAATDDLTGNQAAQDSLRVTGPGWDDGYGAMGVDLNSTDGSTGLDGEAYSTGCRYELEAPGSLVHGVYVRVDPGSEVGGMLRARLFDGNLNELALSDPMQITADDLWAGSVFVPFASPYGPVSGDVIAMVKQEPDSGWVRIATSGASPHGAAYFLSGITEVVDYPTRTPMVRLALSAGGTGVSEPSNSRTEDLLIAPVPASASATVLLPAGLAGAAHIVVFNAHGAVAMELAVSGQAERQVTIPCEGLPSGLYGIVLRSDRSLWQGRLVIAR